MLNIIVAPRTYNPKAEKYTKKVVKFLKQSGEEFSVFFLHSLEEIATNVKEITSFGETEFVVVGDDVVINEFINSIKDFSKIKLGIIPTNKRDDFSSFLGLNFNPTLAIKNIIKRNIVETDLMLVNNLKVINNIVVGASVEAQEKLNQLKFKNFFSKKYIMQKYAYKFEGEELTISSKNNKAKTEKIYDLVIANGGNSKGKSVSPLSNVKDGLINVTYKKFDEKSGNKKYIKKTIKGKHIYVEDVKQLWLNNVKITNSKNHIKAMLDGKIVNLDYLDVSVVEKGIKIYK